MHVKKDDEVLVLAGNDRGKTGRVLRVIPKQGRVVVEGVNLRTKHLRRSQANPQGGRVEREFPIHASNVRKAAE
jgi:large subunit ribosomal protein L24